MDHCSNSYVNSAHSYFSLKNYNKVISGLVVGPPEPKNTPYMNPQIVLNYQIPHNPYDSLTYDSTPGNYYTVSTGQYGRKTCEVNMPRRCVGPPVSGPPVSGQPAKRVGSSCMTGTQNPCGKNTNLQCHPLTDRVGGPGTCKLQTRRPVDVEHARAGDAGQGWERGVAGPARAVDVAGAHILGHPKFSPHSLP